MAAPTPTRATKQVELKLWNGGSRLITNRDKANLQCSAGIGWGKSELGCEFIKLKAAERCKDSLTKKSLIIAPSHRHLKRHHYPRLRQSLARIGLKEEKHYRLHKQDGVVEFGKKLHGYQIFLASAENWQNIVGWEFDDGWWDEPGYGSEELRDNFVERIGRVGSGSVGQKLYTGVIQLNNWYMQTFGYGADLQTTEYYTLPQWVDEYAPGWGGKELIRFRESKTTLCLHAASFESHVLKGPYYHALWETYGYKVDKFRAHVLGEPVAQNTNAVYDEFDEPSVVGDYPVDHQGETAVLNLAFDFNVGRMTVIVIQSYAGSHYVVWEGGEGLKTTFDACAAFLKAFPPEKYGNRILRIYGDHGGYRQSSQVRYQYGDYSIIDDCLKGKYRMIERKARRDPIPQNVRVSATNKFHALAKQSRELGLSFGKGLFVDRKCRKCIEGWRSAQWNLKTGKIHKPGTDDDKTHAPEAVDYFMVIEEPPIELQGAAGA